MIEKPGAVFREAMLTKEVLVQIDSTSEHHLNSVRFSSSTSAGLRLKPSSDVIQGETTT